MTGETTNLQQTVDQQQKKPTTATNDNKSDNNNDTEQAPSSIHQTGQLSQQVSPANGGGSSSATSAAGSTSTPPRRPRPIRPNLRRQVVVAAPADHQLHQVGVPMGSAQIELAGVLQPAGRATLVPPKRPARLPAARIYQHSNLHPHAHPHHHPHHHHHRLQTSLGATVSTAGGAAPKPNRYNLALMQQWQAAAAAAATGEHPPPPHPPPPPLAETGPTGGFHYHLPSPFSSAASRVLYVNPTLVNLSEHTKSRLIKFIEALKKFSEKWFSHVLLLMFLAVYACLGAYVFISFEAPTEQWEKQLIIDTRQRIVNDSYDEAHAKSREDYFELFRMQFEEYERLLNRVCASGMSSSSLENQWTFWGGLFYSMTVFTTIGYGHLTPITFAGRVATMVYAIFGIPILLMVLADLGKLLTRIIKYAFKQFNYMYNKLLRRKASVRTRKLISDNTNQYIGVARDAFERGFAYIQPYQQRIHPAAFLSSHYGARANQTAAAAAAAAAAPGRNGPPKGGDDKLATGGQDHPQQEQRMQSTEVIVTPNKQTKPVSPQPGQNASKKAPLAGEHHPTDHHHHHHNSNNNNHHHHHHHLSRHGRSLSPGLQQKSRKISTSNRQEHSQVGSSKKANVRSGVSRSSSSSNVAPNALPATNDHKKRASADHSINEQSTQTFEGQKKDTTQTSQQEDELPAGEPCETDKTINQIDHQQDELDHQEEVEVEKELEEEDEDEDEDEEDFDIPVSFALFLLITYMMFGAAVFSIWEGWNFFDALYFVFISMSTIGFGDLVPQHPKVMVGTFAYLLFGLALTSMCINVVQEKIHATFLRAKMQIGEKMGFDLDQIMADDYYDGGSAFDDEPNGADDDLASVAAMSQTNSSTGAPGTLAPPDAEGGEAADSRQHKKATVSLDGVAVDALSAGGGQKSPKSKESNNKWRTTKRNNNNNDVGLGGSFRRKLSSKKQAPVRQLTPSTPSTNTTINQTKQSNAPTSCNKYELQPIKSQLEVIRTTSGSPPDPTGELNRGPGINQPIARGASSFCEPLTKLSRPVCLETTTNDRRTSPVGLSTSTTNRRTLTATRSQPNSLASKSLDSPNRPPLNHSSNNYNENNNNNNNNNNANKRYHSVRQKGRSLGNSRRASVSDELNQLDDLIVSLSHSPSERFGPLLGIPATTTTNSSTSGRTSRSVSPSASVSTTFGGRRGTSMTSRLCSSAATSPRPVVQKKRSLASQLPPSNQQHLAPSTGRQSSFINLTGAARAPLNLSESQAALDELEALKFSPL